MTKPEQVKVLLGRKIPILDREEVMKAVQLLHDQYEGERWPDVEECFHLMVLDLNRKYICRRKLCGFRPLLRTEFFTSDNLGNSVIAKKRACVDSSKSQPAKAQPANSQPVIPASSSARETSRSM